MIKRGDKAGQFYLIAAIIIIAIIVGFATIINYSKEKNPVKIYDLGEELKIESENVLDYGVHNGLGETEMANLLMEFIENYSEHGEEKNLYFIFGTQAKITVVVYQESEDEIYVDVGDGNSQLTISEGTGAQDFSPSINKVIITIKKIEYEFELKKGENFYFVISQEVEGEQYVVTN